jgi:hypothetical protein
METKFGEILTCLPRLAPWLQGLWVAWVVAGIILLVVSLNLFPAKPTQSPNSASPGPAEPTPVPTPTPAATPAPNPAAPSTGENEKWIVIPVEGKDRKGKVATFEINILSQEFNWAYESATLVELNGVPVDVVKHFQSAGLQYRFGRSLSIIAVGTASEEGTQDEEEKRAEKRAKQLVVWIRETLQAPLEIYKLNLGHYKPSGQSSVNHGASAWQRSIVVIGVVEKDEEVNVEEALYSALMKKAYPPITPRSYSRFDLVRSD